MNQILIEKDNKSYTLHEFEKNKKNLPKIPILFFGITILSIFIFSIYFFYNHYTINKKNMFSQKLTDSFEISKLYSSPKISSDDSSKNIFIDKLHSETDFYIIGILEIKSLNLNYPILSNYSDDFSKIAPCRIAGPLPNEIGNLCIAAHNYNNSTFFSKISLLQPEDIITIYNSYGKSLDYEVIENTQIDFDDISCLSQETNSQKIITLITCNNTDNSKRYMIKAKEKE